MEDGIDRKCGGDNQYYIEAKSGANRICGSPVSVLVCGGVPTVLFSVTPNPVRIGESARFSVYLKDGGTPPYSYRLEFDDGSSSDVRSWPYMWEYRSYTTSGAHNASVTIHDASGVELMTTTTLTVLPEELKVWFTSQSSHLKVGETGTWQVGASGGTPRYFHEFQFTGGSPSGGGNWAENTFDKKGVYQLTVTVRDSGSPEMSKAISCGIIVEEDCQAPNVLCGPNCIPASAECCFPGTGGYCLDQCCSYGCCDADMVCCHDHNCCYPYENCCPSGNCCGAGKPCCGSSHCCPDASWFCCPNQTGCCPIGYECTDDGKCTKEGSMVPMNVTESESYGSSNCYDRSYGE